MSEYRQKDLVFKISCPITGQSQLLHCYKAFRFRSKLRHGSRNIKPPIDPRKDEWKLHNLYRVMYNGKWLCKGYVFNTVEEIQKMQIDFIENNKDTE